VKRLAEYPSPSTFDQLENKNYQKMTETDGHKEHRIGMKEETQVFRDN
jgi:hypothetical protein